MIYLCYATTGREFEVEEAMAPLASDVWCGRKIEFLRRGKRRYADAVESPALPNYLFASLTDTQWHAVHAANIKHLASTMYPLTPRDEKDLHVFQKAVEEAHDKASRIARSRDQAAMCQFQAGQQLIDIKGRFGEAALTFRRIVENAANLHPMVEAEMEIMGRSARVKIDPLDLRAAE